MYTKQALRTLGVADSAITADQKRQLDMLGFFAVENVLSTGDLSRMRTEFERIHAEDGADAVLEETFSNIFCSTNRAVV